MKYFILILAIFNSLSFICAKDATAPDYDIDITEIKLREKQNTGRDKSISIASVDASGAMRGLAQCRFTLACDVSTVFYGPDGAAYDITTEDVCFVIGLRLRDIYLNEVPGSKS